MRCTQLALRRFSFPRGRSSENMGRCCLVLVAYDEHMSLAQMPYRPSSAHTSRYVICAHAFSYMAESSDRSSEYDQPCVLRHSSHAVLATRASRPRFRGRSFGHRPPRTAFPVTMHVPQASSLMFYARRAGAIRSAASHERAWPTCQVPTGHDRSSLPGPPRYFVSAGRR